MKNNVLPIDIDINTQDLTAIFIWEDQSKLLLSHQQLREICPCAFCRTKRINKQAISNDTNIHITAMYDQGYGAQICFSDGHDKGIFPWIFLQQMIENDHS